MKKSLKVGMLLSVLLAGGCNNNECNCPNSDDSTVVENIDDKSGHSEEYKETAPSVVMIRVQKKSDTNQISATGSGVVYDEEGQYAYILTNAHVLERADEYHEVEVVFSNEEGKKTGHTELAEIVARDYNEDIAVLRIAKSDKYKVAKIGNTDNLKRQDFVYKIGTPCIMDNPFIEYFNDTTEGVISSFNVGVDTDSDKIDDIYIITHTAILNSGDSGGALFNGEGELIGINTLKYNNIAGKYGALPINYVVKVADYIRVHKTNYTRPRLNISVLSIADMGVNRVNYGISPTVTFGLYVTQTGEGLITPQSIITHIEGVEIHSIDDYICELLKYSTTDSIEITIVNKSGQSIGDNGGNKTVSLHG